MPLHFAAYYRRNPLWDVSCTHGVHETFNYAGSTMTGWKIMQEDALLLKPLFFKKWSLFGVFDGHKGNHVASFLQKNYADHLQSFLEDSSPITALKLSFLSSDSTLRRLQKEIFFEAEEKESSEDKDVNALEFFMSAPLQGEDTDKDDSDFEEAKTLKEDALDSGSLDSIPVEKIEERSIVNKIEESIPANKELDESADQLQGEGTDKDEADFEEAKTLKEDAMDSESLDSIPLEKIEKRSIVYKIDESIPANDVLDESAEVSQFEDTNQENPDFAENKILKEDAMDSESLDSIPLEKIEQKKVTRNIEHPIPANEELNKASEATDFPGSTGTVVLFRKNKLFVANVGDSRCIASIKGEAVELTKDHNPSDPEECKRIINAGHDVVEGCIDGNLNISRAFGDFELKQSKGDETTHAVICYPNVSAVYVTDHIDFIIIASDGLWNSMSNQEVVDFIHQKRDSKTLEEINKELFHNVVSPARRADGIGCDNITAVIIAFENTGQDKPRTFTQEVHLPLIGEQCRKKRKRTANITGLQKSFPKKKFEVFEKICESGSYHTLSVNDKLVASVADANDQGHIISITTTEEIPKIRNIHTFKEKAMEFADLPWAPLVPNTGISIPVPSLPDDDTEVGIASGAENRDKDLSSATKNTVKSHDPESLKSNSKRAGNDICAFKTFKKIKGNEDYRSQKGGEN